MTANSSRTVYHGVNCARSGAGAPSARFSEPATTRVTTGSATAAAYQRPPTRHGTMRAPHRLNPERPSATPITTTAATSGANAPKLPNGRKPQAMA